MSIDALLGRRIQNGRHISSLCWNVSLLFALDWRAISSVISARAKAFDHGGLGSGGTVAVGVDGSKDTGVAFGDDQPKEHEMELPFGVELLGHAATLLWRRDTGAKLLIDPYESGGLGGKIGYKPIEVVADAVVCTHAHEDHSATACLPGSPVRLEGRHVTWQGMQVDRIGTWHDEYEGRRRGGGVEMVRVACEGRVLVHASDVGCAPGDQVLRALGAVDVLLMPVGGVYTVGAAQAWEWAMRLNPRVVVPMHYESVACGLPLRSVENFLAHFASKERRPDLEAVPWSAPRPPGSTPLVVVLPQTYE